MENASKNPELNSNLINQQIEDIQANYDDYIYLTEIINKLLIIMNFINGNNLLIKKSLFIKYFSFFLCDDEIYLYTLAEKN